ELLPYQFADGRVIELEKRRPGRAAHEYAQQDGSGRGPIGEFHAKKRDRQDGAALNCRDDRAEPVERMLDLVAPVSDVGNDRRRVGEGAELKSQCGVLNVE